MVLIADPGKTVLPGVPMDGRKGRTAPQPQTSQWKAPEGSAPPQCSSPAPTVLEPTATSQLPKRFSFRNSTTQSFNTSKMITLSPSAKKIGQTVLGILPLCFQGQINHPLPSNPSVWILQQQQSPKQSPQSWGAMAELQDEPQLISAQAELSPALSFKPEKQINQWENPAFAEAAMVPTVLVLFSEVPAASRAQDEF